MHRQHAPQPPSGEAAHDGPVRKGICNRTIVCGLRACAPECALTVHVGARTPCSAHIYTFDRPCAAKSDTHVDETVNETAVPRLDLELSRPDP